MLTEFAFTPSVFDEDAHEDKEAWRDQLRDLLGDMFPKTAACPVVVSNLYAGAWSSHIVPYVESIADHRAKKYCQELVTHMQRMLVVRPELGEWPSENDIEWCREAISTHTVEPIDRIVSVQATKNAMKSEFAFIRSIEEVGDSGFWQGIGTEGSPKMVIAEQVKLLQKLCLHSEWVAFINPYAFTSEQEFTLQFLNMALNRRHASFGSIDIELHAKALDIVDPVERAKRQARITNNMIHNIEPKLNGSHSVDLYFWPKLLDRILVAGNYVYESDGVRRKSPRWGVSMSHLARGAHSDAPPTEWKLLRRESLDYWFRTFVAEGAANKTAPTSIPN